MGESSVGEVFDGLKVPAIVAENLGPMMDLEGVNRFKKYCQGYPDFSDELKEARLESNQVFFDLSKKGSISTYQGVESLKKHIESREEEIKNQLDTIENYLERLECLYEFIENYVKEHDIPVSTIHCKYPYRRHETLESLSEKIKNVLGVSKIDANQQTIKI